MRRALTLAVALAPLLAAAGPGTVDWQSRTVKCTGSGAPGLRDAGHGAAAAGTGAERAARLDAVRNCLEALRGVTVRAGLTVGDALAADSGLRGRVEGVLRGFKVVGAPRHLPRGGVELDLGGPLDGALAEALLSASDAAPPPPFADPGGATGFLVDARGLHCAPALAPRLLDGAGDEVFAPGAALARARRDGAAAYATDPEAARRELAPRLGERPLTVKPVKAAGPDLVLSPADAEALAAGRALLAEGRLVILVDGEQAR
jgi:hypothetical protein